MTKSEKPGPSTEGATLAQQLSVFVYVLSQFVGLSGAGVGAGWFLWKRAGFPWWCILVTTFFGLWGASYQVIRYQKTLNGK